MTEASKSAAAEKSTAEKAREGAVSWAEFGFDTAEAIQKQWTDIAFGYGDIALKAAKDSLAWVESFYDQSRKNAKALAQTRQENIDKLIERLS